MRAGVVVRTTFGANTSYAWYEVVDSCNRGVAWSAALAAWPPHNRAQAVPVFAARSAGPIVYIMLGLLLPPLARFARKYVSRLVGFLV